MIAVFTITTEHLALWETRLGTLPSILAGPDDGVGRVRVVDHQRPAAVPADVPGQRRQLVRRCLRRAVGIGAGEVLGRDHLEDEELG